ncbi:hypothetical protein DM02DRAFT_654773 [Periconia macrospinosa]|uniref:Uncharacterized protein n=1 Tax=Periconia macrospinosa TaxID=97972 RepID=A0A2V1DSZ4_9PLEO|nr:hypothetical protein DM02DRAFT_654773 [Periconia macrospinosa]
MTKRCIAATEQGRRCKETATDRGYTLCYRHRVATHDFEGAPIPSSEGDDESGSSASQSATSESSGSPRPPSPSQSNVAYDLVLDNERARNRIEKAIHDSKLDHHKELASTVENLTVRLAVADAQIRELAVHLCEVHALARASLREDRRRREEVEALFKVVCSIFDQREKQQQFTDEMNMARSGPKQLSELETILQKYFDDQEEEGEEEGEEGEEGKEGEEEV